MPKALDLSTFPTPAYPARLPFSPSSPSLHLFFRELPPSSSHPRLASNFTSPRPTHRSGVLTLTSFQYHWRRTQNASSSRVDLSTRDLFFLSTSPAFSNGHCLRPREDNVHHSITHHCQPSFGSRSSGQGKKHFIFFFRPVSLGKCPHRQPSTLNLLDLHIINLRSFSSTHAHLPSRPQHTHPAQLLLSLSVVCY